MRRRVGQILPGLLLFGFGLALIIEADLGSNPWTVFSQGVSDLTGLTIGTIVMITGAILVLLFGPVKEPIGIGTVLNIVILGLALDVSLALIPDLIR